MIKSVVKAIKILQILSDADGRSVTLDEISKITGYNKSTCAHIIETLVEENMAERVSRKEGYAIGYGVFMLSRFGGFNHRLKTVSHPVLRWLTARTGQTSIFCVLRGDKRICIDKVVGEFLTGSQNENITVNNLPKSSTGMVLVANLSEYSRCVFFKDYRELADTMEDSPDKLETELIEVKRRGYAENFSDSEDTELRGFAAPVFSRGECVGAVGIPYYGKRNPEYLKQLMIAAKEISRRLEFSNDLE